MCVCVGVGVLFSVGVCVSDLLIFLQDAGSAAGGEMLPVGAYIHTYLLTYMHIHMHACMHR